MDLVDEAFDAAALDWAGLVDGRFDSTMLGVDDLVEAQLVVAALVADVGAGMAPDATTCPRAKASRREASMVKLVVSR